MLRVLGFGYLEGLMQGFKSRAASCPTNSNSSPVAAQQVVRSSSKPISRTPAYCATASWAGIHCSPPLLLA